MRWGILVALGLAACHMTAQSEVEEVSDELCRCLPVDDKCASEVASEIGPMVRPECSQCVFEHERTCASMIDECIPLCFRNVGGL